MGCEYHYQYTDCKQIEHDVGQAYLFAQKIK